MSWNKREAVTNLYILGDGEGDHTRIAGLLVGMPRDQGFKDKTNYQVVRKDGETVTVSGSSTLARQISETDIGKFLKMEFSGWGKSANGKYKIIEVNVWEGDVTEDMKKWPRYAEFSQNGKKSQQTRSDDDDDFGRTAPVKDDEDDDLPC